MFLRVDNDGFVEGFKRTRIFNLHSPDGIVGIEQWLPYISYIGKMNIKLNIPLREKLRSLNIITL